MSIDDKVEGSPSREGVPACYFNGKYNYRTVDKDVGKVYCCASNDKCPYYELVKGKEYCRTKVYNNE